MLFAGMTHSTHRAHSASQAEREFTSRQTESISEVIFC